MLVITMSLGLQWQISLTIYDKLWKLSRNLNVVEPCHWVGDIARGLKVYLPMLQF